MDWPAGDATIDGLRDIVRRNSAAAAREVALVDNATARVSAVQRLLLTSPESAPGVASDPAAAVRPSEPAASPAVTERPPARRAAGVARLREGPLADLFRATAPRPGQA